GQVERKDVAVHLKEEGLTPRVAKITIVVEPGADEIRRRALELAQRVVGAHRLMRRLHPLRGAAEPPRPGIQGPPQPRIAVRHPLAGVPARLAGGGRLALSPDHIRRRTEPPEPRIVGIREGPALEAQRMECAQHLRDRLAGPGLDPWLDKEL